MSKYIFAILILSQSLFSSAQGEDKRVEEETVIRNYADMTYYRLGSRTYHILDRMDILDKHDTLNFFSADKPYLKTSWHPRWVKKNPSKADKADFQYLQTERYFTLKSKKALFGKLYTHPAHFYNKVGQDFHFSVDPIIDFQGGKEAGIAQTRYTNTRGIDIQGSLANKLGFHTRVLENQFVLPTYVFDHVLERNQVLDGAGRTKQSGELIDVGYATGYIAFKPLKFIDLQFGQDRNFIGNGERSLFLSDHSKDYLFLKLNTRFWKINYQNLFTEMVDYRAENLLDGFVRRKFGTFHHFSINLAKNFEFGIFEGVMYGNQDSTVDRQFELHYLNPLILYRAVEFHLGSSDNVVIGLDFKWNLLGRIQLYGQFLLDEFRFFELTQQTQWWGNKYGGQLGLKYINAFGIPNLDVQLEGNMVRPFTYSHNNVAINYSHFSHALAHPLGANFREAIGIIRYQPLPNVNIELRSVFAQKGLDQFPVNFGGNIFRDNSDHGLEYGHALLQGTLQTIYYNSIKVDYMIMHNLFVEGSYLIRKVELGAPVNSTSTTNYLSLGLRYNLSHRRFQY